MRIDAYNQVAQLYNVHKSVKTQKAQKTQYHQALIIIHCTLYKSTPSVCSVEG